MFGSDHGFGSVVDHAEMSQGDGIQEEEHMARHQITSNWEGRTRLLLVSLVTQSKYAYINDTPVGRNVL